MRRLGLTAEVAPPLPKHTCQLFGDCFLLLLNILRRWWFLPPQTPTEGQTLPSTHASWWWRLSARFHDHGKLPKTLYKQGNKYICRYLHPSIFCAMPFLPRWAGDLFWNERNHIRDYLKPPELQDHAASSIPSVSIFVGRLF